MGGDLPNLLVDFLDEPAAIGEQMTAALANRAWLLLIANNTNPHGFPQDRNRAVKEKVTTNNYHRWLSANGSLLEEKMFPGISLSLFQLNRAFTQ